MTAVGLDTLLKRQQATLGYIDRFWENTSKIGKEKITPLYLSTRLELLETYWTKFVNNHDLIIEYEEATSTDYIKKGWYQLVEETYITTKVQIRSGLTNQGNLSVNESTRQTVDNDCLVKQIQLPRINLPTFAGDQLAWEAFRDLFKSLVHDAEGLAPVQKLQYLTASLTGEAATVVANVEMSASGYAIAWDELVLRYDNKRVLLTARMRALLGTPPITKPAASEIKRLVTAVNQSARSFRALGRPVDYWDDWFVHLLVDKLDASSRLHWESTLRSSQEFPKLEDLMEFLRIRIRALEAAQPSTASTASSKPSRIRLSSRKDDVLSNAANVHSGSSERMPCALCHKPHSIRSCVKFKALAVDQRRNVVNKRKVCFNCLGPDHSVNECQSLNRCRLCQQRHHSLLHLTSPTTTEQPSTTTASTSMATESCSHAASGNTVPIASKVSALTSSVKNQVLLATARVNLISRSGLSVSVRALLDSGSEATFVTERVAQLLRLPRRRVNVVVSGLQGSSTGIASHAVSLMVGSDKSPSMRVAVPRALVLTRLTSLTPGRQGPREDWPHLDGLTLADPMFDTPAPVDAILGADIYGLLLEDGLRRGPVGSPVAQLTIFGWVLMGSLTTQSDSDPCVAVHHALPMTDLHRDLQRFWLLEEVPLRRFLSQDEKQCEEIFSQTHYRDASGRYVVRLPKKATSTSLGASRLGALRTLQGLERRLDRDPGLRSKYNDFMSEYLKLGHMEPIAESESRVEDCYYLPHHAVFKTTDPNPKLRVVFNASFCTSSGRSLNDMLLPGPKLQSELWLVLTLWRMFRVAFSADIIKMFRQIRVHPEDINLQRILWRSDPSDKVQDFRLTTVTYGTTPAPYLAIRTLLQLANDEGARYPLGALALRSHSYVDDILYGADSSQDALEAKKQLIDILSTGGFQLSKWSASHAELCPDGDTLDRRFKDPDTVSTLGIIWSPLSDSFMIRAVPELSSVSRCTKRSILSDTAKFFDPLGWISPVFIFAKIFLQELWKSELDWDEPLPETLRRPWIQFTDTLTDLAGVRVPRWVQSNAASDIELHGFSDASARAYSAVVFLRVAKPDGTASVHLLMAKTKVAPLKSVTIPRLELCGALLLAQLITAVAEGLGCEPAHIHAWTDSRVALDWIRSCPSRWKVFVANRVASIQELVPSDKWNHVRTEDNPADPASRGVRPTELAALDLWWYGPPWLTEPRKLWPKEKPSNEADTSEEKKSLASAIAQDVADNDLLLRFSSLNSLFRVTALCLRFVNRLKFGRHEVLGPLTSSELSNARLLWVKLVQREDFPNEIRKLSSGCGLKGKSPLLSLRPFLDDQGVLRVGGRLQQAQMPFNERHPMILGQKSHLSLLLVRDAHARTLHGGTQLTRSVLSRQFWILHGGSLVRRVIHRCIRCTRFRAAPMAQQMGQLPADRVRAARPFLFAGVDYAGPVQLRLTGGRGSKAYKGYVCLFVCLSSRAVHLELVSSLTSTAFIAAFRRLVARRGRCSRLYSDNATTFKGADRELQRMFSAGSEFYQNCRAQLAGDGTEWSFIPPSAPHFGGLWEAGVKSVKHHLRRILGEHTLTFEEFSTLLCQIEACLNSRPLHPLSNDPDDIAALTPGHLLIGEAPINLPENPTLDLEPEKIHSRWLLLTKLRDQFWYRWKHEYLHHLQQLSKWKQRKANLTTGALVLIKDELSPPAKWELGRITALYPGPDGLIRVADVRTATSSFTRPITKLCLLPVPVGDSVAA